MDTHPPLKLAIVEVLDRDGHARLSVPVWRWPVSIGRAIACDVVLDDVHVAPLHVTLGEEEGALRLSVGETINGVQLGSRRLVAREHVDLTPGDVFEVGGTRLRVRRAVDALAPEHPLVPEPAGSRLSFVILFVALALWSAGHQWLNSDPGGRLTDYAAVLLGLPLLLTAWCGFWAVGSKLVRHRFDFPLHLRIAFSYVLLANVVGLLLPLAAFSFGWTFLSRIASLVAAGVLWAMVLAHVTLILPARRPLLTGVMGALFIGGLSLLLVRNYQVRDRVFNELYVTTLAPPAFRLAPTVATGRFIEEARQLKAVLDAHVKDDDTGESTAVGTARSSDGDRASRRTPPR